MQGWEVGHWSCELCFNIELLQGEGLHCFSLGFREAELFLSELYLVSHSWGDQNTTLSELKNQCHIIHLSYLTLSPSNAWLAWDWLASCSAKWASRGIWIELILKGNMFLCLPLLATEAKHITSGVRWKSRVPPEFFSYLTAPPCFVYTNNILWGDWRGRTWLQTKPRSFLICQKIPEKNSVLHVCW